MTEEHREQSIIAEEERLYERVDDEGNKWRKVYFGGGAHFKNWLDQVIELCGEGNVHVEEVERTGLQCFDLANEKVYRIWVRESGQGRELT